MILLLVMSGGSGGEVRGEGDPAGRILGVVILGECADDWIRRRLAVQRLRRRRGRQPHFDRSQPLWMVCHRHLRRVGARGRWWRVGRRWQVPPAESEAM